MNEVQRIPFRVPDGAFAVAYLEQRPGGWLVGWSTGKERVASQSKQAGDFGPHRPTRFVALDAARLEMFAWWQPRNPFVSQALAEAFDVEELVDERA